MLSSLCQRVLVKIWAYLGDTMDAEDPEKELKRDVRRLKGRLNDVVKLVRNDVF